MRCHQPICLYDACTRTLIPPLTALMFTTYLFAIESIFLIENPEKNFLIIMKDGKIFKDTLPS